VNFDFHFVQEPPDSAWWHAGLLGDFTRDFARDAVIGLLLHDYTFDLFLIHRIAVPPIR
jgi:hypothetical protein